MPDKRIIFNNHERKPQYMKGQPKGMPVGWCKHNAHRGKLSVKQMKNHRCLAKGCPFFVKNEKHYYWEQRARVKKTKKTAKIQARLTDSLKAEILTALNRLEESKYGR